MRWHGRSSPTITTARWQGAMPRRRITSRCNGSAWRPWSQRTRKSTSMRSLPPAFPCLRRRAGSTRPRPPRRHRRCAASRIPRATAMCGIVGIFDLSAKRPIPRELVSRMNDSQFHRGPDEVGLHFEPGVGFGHRRLSIIDLSTGQQPLFNEDRSVVIVYNGEIYNYRDLIPELSRLGHAFRTKSDTEVIVHAWEQWGEDCVQRLRGMFAFVLWDRNRETLFLARDRLGVKPLYYAPLDDGTLIFGSELKSLLTHPGFKREIDPRAVEDYLAYGYVPEPRTIFGQALKLPPGCTLALRRGGDLPQPRQYWDVPFKPSSPLTLEAAE